MKFFFILSFFMFIIQLGANELTWVDEQIEAIKPPRSGVSDSEVNALKNPFYFSEKNILKDSTISNTNLTASPGNSQIRVAAKQSSYTLSSKDFKLSVIINGSALINAKWYKLNDKIKGFTVLDIGTSEVLLSKKGKKILLSTDSNILNLKLKAK